MVHIRCQTQISPLQKRFFPGEWTNFLPAIESIPPRDESGCSHAELLQKGVEIIETPRDQDHGHRSLFFKDPEGNILEIYADI